MQGFTAVLCHSRLRSISATVEFPADALMNRANGMTGDCLVIATDEEEPILVIERHDGEDASTVLPKISPFDVADQTSMFKCHWPRNILDILRPGVSIPFTPLPPVFIVTLLPVCVRRSYPNVHGELHCVE